MNITKLSTGLVLAFTFLAGCGGPEGTYKLDKEAMTAAMQAEIDKKPKEEQGFAKLGLAMMAAMDITLDVQSGGKLTMKTAMPNLMGSDKTAEEKSEDGTWTVEGDKINLKTDKETIACKLDGKKIECAGKKEGDPGLTFIKQ